MRYRLLTLWLLGYAAAWTVATVCVDPTVPYDAIEALNWGQNMAWGSPKNPWLVGMVFWPAIALPALPLNVYWYASHFLGVAAGMAGSWHLARQLSGSTRLAWLALLTLNLSGLINFDIISYNDNYLLVALWPWMMLFFLLALSRSDGWWLAFAVAAALATMAKYSTLALVGAVFLATLLAPALRRCYRQPVFYAAMLIYLLLVTPNVLWLWQHDFAALRWVDSQIKAGLNTSLFITLLCVFYPLLFQWWILRRRGCAIRWPRAWTHQIMLVVYLAPLLLISSWFLFHRGGRLTEWLQPFFILAPALLVGCVTQKPQSTLRRACFPLAWFAVVVLGGYLVVMQANVANAGQKWRGVIPFSHAMDSLWRARYATPLAYVGGGNLAQWLTFYAPSRPRIITRWNNTTLPNIYNAHIRREDIRREGALLMGHPGEACSAQAFRDVLRDWPDIKIDAMQQTHFQGDAARPRQRLCIGFVAPAGK